MAETNPIAESAGPAAGEAWPSGARQPKGGAFARRVPPEGGSNRARIIWAMVVSGQPYDEAKAFKPTPGSLARRLKNLHHQAQSLNMKLVPA